MNLSALPFLYLTTTGRTSGQPRRIEIWFVLLDGKAYLFAEHFHKAKVRNIQADARVRVQIGGRELAATARVLDEKRDNALWHATQRAAREKYGWGDGLPVEITPDEPL